jgi:hypothetical protein
MEYTSKSTDELQVGDVVQTYGMRVLLEDEPHTFEGFNGTTAYAYKGRVLNMEEALGEHRIPRSFIADGFWTIQGNELARWSVEVPDEESARRARRLRRVLPIRRAVERAEFRPVQREYGTVDYDVYLDGERVGRIGITRPDPQTGDLWIWKTASEVDARQPWRGPGVKDQAGAVWRLLAPLILDA